VPAQSLPKVLSTLPGELREALTQALNEVRQNYIERRWEPSELNGGKMAEAIYRILEWHASSTSSYTPIGSQIKDFGKAVRRFENQASMPDSVRFHIPNALIFLYTVRNKRGVGHLGNEVNPNQMDSEAVLSMSNWVTAELVRLLHSVTIEEAQQAVEELLEKRNPLVWEVADVRRVLNPAMSHTERVLVLLHSSHPRPVAESDLFEWCEYSSASSFRSQVLKKAHKERLIEYDTVRQLVYISPTGIKRAEQLLLSYM
jgi:hypothetical protein